MSSPHVGLNRSCVWVPVSVVLSKEERAVSGGSVATGNAGFFCPGTIMLRVGWF